MTSGVTMAIVLLFVVHVIAFVALFALIGALGFFALSTVLGIFVLFAVLYLALAAVNVWGGIQAMQGKGSTILKIGGAVTAGLALLGLILTLTQGTFDFSSLVAVAIGVAIFLLLSQPASRQYFAARGAR